jgi:hypothetical protein
LEKKFVKSTVGPLMLAAAPPTQSIWATFLPARSAALAIVSAWRTPAAENEVRFEKVSPLRKYVLLVEPWSAGYAPVAIVYQPTPVLGGNAWSIPLSPVTPVSMSALYVGMTPSAAYFSMRSGRMPSEANSTVRLAAPTGDDGSAFVGGAAVTGPATIENSKAIKARRTSGRKRLDDLGTVSPPQSRCLRPVSRIRGSLNRSRPVWTGHIDPGAHTITRCERR